jgi:hypothetical protein
LDRGEEEDGYLAKNPLAFSFFSPTEPLSYSLSLSFPKYTLNLKIFHQNAHVIFR